MSLRDRMLGLAAAAVLLLGLPTLGLAELALAEPDPAETAAVETAAEEPAAEEASAAEAAPAGTIVLERNIVEHAALDKEVNKALKARNATGAALLIAKDGVVVYEHYYGYSHVKNNLPITAETYFRTASVSKMISAVGVMTLADAGLLDIDADLSDYFGYTIRNARFKNTPITMRMVMSHTSSFYDGGGFSSGKTSLQYLIDLKNKRTSNFTKNEPGTAYLYSNLNGGMLGAVMEQISGETINGYMHEHVFDRLGMKATYDIASAPDPENVSSTYKNNRSIKQAASLLLRREYDNTVNPDAHFRTTAGSVWATGEDLLKIGMLLEQGGTLNGVTILQPETVAMMMESQEGKGGVTVDSPYGLNINRMTDLMKDRMVYGHQGMNGALLANVYFVPESDFVFAFVSNGINNNMSNHIAQITRTLFALTWKEFCGE